MSPLTPGSNIAGRIAAFFVAVLVTVGTSNLALAQNLPELPVKPPTTVGSPGTPHLPGVTLSNLVPASQSAAVKAMSGVGMYIWQWDKTGSVDQVLGQAQVSRIDFIVVRASSAGDGFYLADILGELIPKAHRIGVNVIAYDPPRFEDVEADAQRAYTLMSFRSQGQGIDAFAADIEPAWSRINPQVADVYGRRLRELAGDKYPLVGIVYPPNLVGARYPFAEVARWFDVLSPMSYWRARTLDSATFVRDSVAQLASFGKPVSVSGQAFSYNRMRNTALRGHPAAGEIAQAMQAARDAGAVGFSFWVWQEAEPWLFDLIRDSGWNGYGRGIGVRPPHLGGNIRPGAVSPPPMDPTPEPVSVRESAVRLEARAARAKQPPSGLEAIATLFAMAALAMWFRLSDPRRWSAFSRELVAATEKAVVPFVVMRYPPGSKHSAHAGQSRPVADSD